jgi:5-methylcytosine-specific restriction endonuclease McrA
MILARDRFQCQIRRPGCTQIADTVDHIVSPALFGGQFLDPANLRAACRACNFSRGAEQANLTRAREERALRAKAYPPLREW